MQIILKRVYSGIEIEDFRRADKISIAVSTAGSSRRSRSNEIITGRNFVEMSVLKILWILLITAFEMISFCNSLIGDHVCSRIENYTVTSYETYTEPVVVNTFTWCLQIPPRCPKTRTELRQRYRVKTEEKSKTVEECCKGYKLPMIHSDECLPFCEKCLQGVCTAPNVCRCVPGYYGDACDRECPSGFWGLRCAQTCDCAENGGCDPVNGTCRCPPGLRGSRCGKRCATGEWGANCANRCTCQNRNNNCDPVTGKCIDDDDDAATSIEQTSGYLQSSTVKYSQTSRINNTEYTEVISVPHHTTERQTEDTDDSWRDAKRVQKTTTVGMMPPRQTAINETQLKDPPTTARPVIVLVSVPERKRDVQKDKQNFATKDAFFRNVHRDEERGIVVPKIDFVKTVQKDNTQTTPVPLDIALIIVAAIVSLGLTSVAVVMVLHMRSKLFETVRLAIYDEEKIKNPAHGSVNNVRSSTVVNSSLPPLPIRVNPMFTPNIEPETILTVDGIESLNTYANGAATIGLRISGNLRDLLQDGHYDRPPTTLIRLQASLDQNTEHVYDEIPLQTSPLSDRKDV